MRSATFLSFTAAFASVAQGQKSDAAFCSSKMTSFFQWAGAGPTTPPAVLSYIATATGSRAPLTTFDPHGHVDEICSIAAKLPPGSLQSEFHTYFTSLFEFIKSSSTVMVEVATDCEPATKTASILSYIHSVIETPGNPCTTQTPTQTGTPYPTAAPAAAEDCPNPTTPAPTATATLPSSGSYPTSIPTGGAARPTGILMGAAAMGGLLGAAVML